MRSLISRVSLLVSFCVWAPSLQANPALAEKAQEILKTHCYQCHGKEGTNEGGFNFVLDAKQLAVRKRLIPGDSDRSKLIKRMLNSDDPMPPAETNPRPSKEDIELLRSWIDSGAQPIETAPVREFISHEAIAQKIQADLAKVKERDRPYLRYFTLTHLYNAGLGADELQSFRHGISKLINSLSWGGTIWVPEAIDAEKTILRIDLRNYQWNEKTWDNILSRNPYGVQFEYPSFRRSAEDTRCILPFVRGDWFVAAASRPPLNHEILALPTLESGLEKLLRINTLENIRQERVARAGFNSSGVSRNNRLIERHETGGMIYWKSYDFAGNINRQNLFSHPLGPIPGALSFDYDGGEIIFSLPNGLQAYYLIDNKGNRIDKGPTAIVSDPRRPDRAVENGLSCMSCHARGLIEKSDQIRAHAVKNPAIFSLSQSESILALYPEQEKLAELMRMDAKRFQEAVAKTGAPLSATEPIFALTARFEAEMDFPLVSAETGVTVNRLAKTLEQSAPLAKILGSLLVEGGTIQRQVYIDCFPELVDTLRLGSYQANRNVACDRLIRRGMQFMEKKDFAQALTTFEQAIDLEFNTAEAHAGMGDALRLQSEHSQAIAAYTQAIRLDPRVSQYHNNRGLAQQRAGRVEQALADFSTAIRIDPLSAPAYHNRGVAYYNAGDLDRAIADYNEAIKIDPQLSLAYNNRGYALIEKEAFDKAIDDFDQAIRLKPKFAIAFSNRGLALLFLIGDAPPHVQHMGRTMKAVDGLRKKGVAIYPIACSGYDDACEFVWRSSAFLTGSQFLFLTDDSGVGAAHGEPRIPYYQVERLERLMVRMIASELSGQTIPASAQEIIRTVGRKVN